MNIYDFDNTIFKGDSSYKFIWYSLIRHPFKVIKCFFKSLKHILKKDNVGLIKSELFSFVKDIKNIDEYIDKFTTKYMKNIKDFYFENKKDDDIVISASFDFIINSFCKKIGIKNVIATKYDLKKGKIIGNNCKGKEKIKRLYEKFPNVSVNNAYSDSYSDIPMFEIAKRAYLVKGDDLIEYRK